mgnify:CR=1 FL=1
MVNDVKSIRKNFYFTEENSKKLDLIVDYLQEKSHLGEGRNCLLYTSDASDEL